jgi:hypothetical protein
MAAGGVRMAVYVDSVCTACGSVGRPERVTKGSFLIELALWLFFLLPGLIYSLWRMTSKHWACRQCGSPSLVPANSPVGQKLIAGGK